MPQKLRSKGAAGDGRLNMDNLLTLLEGFKQITAKSERNRLSVSDRDCLSQTEFFSGIRILSVEDMDFLP